MYVYIYIYMDKERRLFIYLYRNVIQEFEMIGTGDFHQFYSHTF